jgi:hypothetical protein
MLGTLFTTVCILLLLWIGIAFCIGGLRLTYPLLILQGVALISGSIPWISDLLYATWPKYNFLFWVGTLVYWLADDKVSRFLKQRETSIAQLLAFKV